MIQKKIDKCYSGTVECGLEIAHKRMKIFGEL